MKYQYIGLVRPQGKYKSSKRKYPLKTYKIFNNQTQQGFSKNFSLGSCLFTAADLSRYTNNDNKELV